MDDLPKKRGRRPVANLTDTQRHVLREVQDFVVQHGFPPTAQELASILGVSSATAHEQVSQLVRKGFIGREPRKARGLTVLREPEEELVDLVSIPLLGTIPAGPLSLAEESPLGEVMVERRMIASGSHFALRVTGDSMQGAAISDGDLVIVRQQPVAQSGDIVVALLDNEGTVKRLSIREHEIELRPENPDFAPIPITPDRDLRIVGKVVAVRRQGG